MSISSEINRIKTAIADAYESADEKGATLPTNQNVTNLASTIDSITGGGGGDLPEVYTEETYSGTYLTKAVMHGQPTVRPHCYRSNTGLTQVVLPSTCSAIETYAFYGCNSLGTVNLPDSITSIGQYAFNGCTNLNISKFPSSLTMIDGYSFRNDTHLGQVDMTECSNMSSVGTYTFAGCTNFDVVGDSLPDSITNIGTYCFDGCSNLEITELPTGNGTDAYRSPGNYAFRGCSKLKITELPMPSGTKSKYSMADHIFENCTGIKSMYLNSKIQGTGSFTFKGCTALETVTCGEYPTTSSVTIGTDCFANCTALETVTICRFGSSTIHPTAFSNCPALTDIYVTWEEGKVANAPWGATNATIHYNYTPPAD